MTRMGLALCLALIAFGSVNAVGSCVAVLAARLARLVQSPIRRSRRLLMIRLLPSGVSLLFVAGLFLPAFLLLEPSATTERVTPLMLGLAAAVAIILIPGPVRAMLSGLATFRLVRRWRRGARPAVLPGLEIPAWVIDSPFPLVTVVGVFRPRLYVARQVIEGCSRAEISAVVGHEVGHVENRDNWKRLLLALLPDWLSLTRWATRMEGEWCEASEDAADDHAARAGSPIDLASALVKVARLAPQADPGLSPVSTLYRGHGLERRIGRLLRGPVDRAEGLSDRPIWWMTPVVVAAVLALGIHRGLLDRVHEITEAVVRLLQ